jgi:glutathione peroxidase
MKTALRWLAFPILLGALMSAQAACPGLLDQKMESLAGDDIPLCKYAGSVLLVVNTASRCGYTPQYEGLEKLYRKYKAQGLVVLGFPSNDFGAQEPGSAHEIARFCEQNYGVTFPMFAKTGVSAGGANSFYEKLATASGGSRPRWNFHKYLVDRRAGKVIAFDTKVTPQDPKFVAEIERLLAER